MAHLNAVDEKLAYPSDAKVAFAGHVTTDSSNSSSSAEVVRHDIPDQCVEIRYIASPDLIAAIGNSFAVVEDQFRAPHVISVFKNTVPCGVPPPSEWKLASPIVLEKRERV